MIGHLLQIAAWVELAICWIAWSFAFVRPRRLAVRNRKVIRASASRLGIFFNLLGFAFICAYVHPFGFEKTIASLVISMVIGPPSVLLAWAATRHLGRHWRYEAAVAEDHELIKTGPYARMRHPIYASMLGMMVATGAAYTWWPLFAVGMLLFFIGTEIRVKAEEHLLEQFFQDEFIEYRARVPFSFIPFLR